MSLSVHSALESRRLVYHKDELWWGAHSKLAVGLAIYSPIAIRKE